MDWFVYMVSCVDGSLYTGITTDLKRRLNDHQSQGKKCAKYLRGKDPLTLVFAQLVGSKSDATRIELKIKKLSKLKKEEIIRTQMLTHLP